MIFSVPLVSSLLSVAAANELALYWGQNSAGGQKSLGDYCQNSAGDIYLISFISSFGSGNKITLDINGYNNHFPGTNLVNAPEIGQDIKTCQGLGKKVLLSLGGANGNYGFSSAEDAENVATELWNYFGGGTSSTRPFGDAKIDGFDLDGENNLNAENYVPFVNKLRQLYATDGSKKYYATAAPQCVYPDATVGRAVAEADLDYLFIQFYNNYCSLSGNQFNYDTWQNFASSSAPNKNVKLLVGLPGSPTAAGSGYISIDDIKQKLPEFANSANFGGFMAWDASQADSNKVGGSTFADQLKALAGGSNAPSSSSAPAPQSSSSTPAGPVKTTSPAASSSAQQGAWNPQSTQQQQQGGWAPETTQKGAWTPATTVAGGPNYQYQATATGIAAQPTSDEDCLYTTTNNVVVRKTMWATQYTTVWV